MHHYTTTTDKRCKQSQLELNIMKEIRDAGFDIVPQVKLGRWVFDAAIQGTPILIEINGDYWHQLPEVVTRDQKKREWCHKRGYTLIVIAEDVWRAGPEQALRQLTDTIAISIKNLTTTPASTGAAAGAGRARSAPERNAGSGEWIEPFLAALAWYPNVRYACKQANVSRTTVYERRENDPDFAARWLEAIADGIDELEIVAFDRAHDQSDTVLLRLLEAHRPEVYSRKMKVEMREVDLSRLTEGQLEALARGESIESVLRSTGESGA
jgi:very-short-patch-repair endonuclease